MRQRHDDRGRQRWASLFALFVVVLGARGVVAASLNHQHQRQNEDQKSTFSVDDIDTAPKLTADFESEDVARAIDVVMFEGPAYEGCCPMHGGEDGDEGEGELLACCRTGGCCPSTEPGGGYGKHLACCESESGSEEENRGKSRVWYSGPSYDGCCPNEDGEDLTCCGEEDGCCPADGAKRHSCCPDIAGGVTNDGGGYDDAAYSSSSSSSSSRAEDLGQYDDGEVDAVQGEESGSGGDDGGVASYWTRKRLDDETASSTETVDNLDDASTVYLQLAAMGCVVVWIVALVVSGVYARRDGRGGEDERLLPNF